MRKYEIQKKNIEAKKNNWLNVFLIASPTISIASRLIIDKYKIEKENILLISLRSTDLELFDNKKIYITPKKYDGYLEKFFFLSPKGSRIYNVINKSKKKFLLYTSWAFREVNWLLKSKLSAGHVYLDEGKDTYHKYI